MSGLLSAAAIAGSVTTILGCVAILGRYAMRFPPFAKAVGWLREGWREDREERLVSVVTEHLPPILDETLAFNGTRSFRADMRIFYATVTDFMAESRTDRADLHSRLDSITNQGERHA